MKQKLISILVLLSLSLGVCANGVNLTRGEITELFFDANGNWTLEVNILFANAQYDSALCFYSRFDSAFLTANISTAGIHLFTKDDFTSNFYIHPGGDSLYILSYISGYGLNELTQKSFVYGDHPNSRVNAPQQGQSLIGLHDIATSNIYVVKDNSHSLGYESDPEKGTIRGFVYDSTGIPMPYQQLHLFGVCERIIYTDENGYFEDNATYGMNNEIYIRKHDYTKLFSDFYTVEPDSVTEVEIILPTEAYVELNGRIILENQQTSPDCYAIFTSVCPDGPIDTFRTDTEGFYTANLIAGNYYVRWSKEQYIPHFSIAPIVFYNDATLGYWQLSEGTVNEIERGQICDHWESNAPYYIFGDLSIESGDSLLIDPGCEINICGGYWIDIHGRLLAEGTAEDTIIITRHESIYGNWRGIQILGPEAAESNISYCKIVGPAYFNIINASPVISHNYLLWIQEIRIGDTSSPIFNYNKIKCNIDLKEASSPVFNHNYLSYKGSVCVTLNDNTSPSFNYNTFNSFWVVFMDYSEEASLSIKGNIFTNGGNLFWNWGGNDPPMSEIDHNIFYEVYSWYANIPGLGIPAITNSNGDSCDIYFNIMHKDPLFVDPENGDFHLLQGSPCIDAGDPNAAYDPDNTIADIGAYYFDQLGIFVKEPSPFENKYTLTAIPNPNSGSFTIEVISPEVHHYEAVLHIISINGNLLETRNIACLERGKNKIRFENMGRQHGLHDGIYICTLSINGRSVVSTKIVVVGE